MSMPMKVSQTREQAVPAEHARPQPPQLAEVVVLVSHPLAAFPSQL